MLVSGQLVHLKPDMPAGGRILDCVGEDIHQHLIQTVGVCQHVFVLQMGVYRKGLAALACLLADDAVKPLLCLRKGRTVQIGHPGVVHSQRAGNIDRKGAYIR